MRNWKPEDIFTVACPHCQAEIEFWKDEPVRLCSACRKEVRNPRIDQGCTEWCKHGPQCLEPSHEHTDVWGAKTQPPAAGNTR
jgi:predicted amidophosphoribosyltransferase